MQTRYNTDANMTTQPPPDGSRVSSARSVSGESSIPSSANVDGLYSGFRYAALFWSLAVTIVYVYVCISTLFEPFNYGDEKIWAILFVAVSTMVVLSQFAPPIVLRVVLPCLIVAMLVTIVIRSGSVGALSIAILLMTAALGLGDGLMRVLRLDADGSRGLEMTLVRLMAGVGMLGVLGFLLATVRLLEAPIVAALFAVSAALSVRPLRALHRRSQISGLLPLVRERPALIAIGGYMVLLNLTWTVAPEVQFDALNYHLPVAAAYARAGGVVDLLFTHSYLAGLLESVYSLALVFGIQTAARMIPFAIALICAGCVYALTDRVAGRRAAAWAAILFYSIPLIMWASGTTDVEIALGGFIATLTISLMRWRESGQTNWLYVAAVLLGAGLGVKPTMGLILPVLGVLLLHYAIAGKDSAFRTRLRTAFFVALISLAMCASWPLLRERYTGNPFYPVFNNWFPVHRYVPEVGPPLGGNVRVPLATVPLIQFPAAFTFNTVAYSESGVTSGGVGPYLLLAIPALVLIRRDRFDLNLLCATAFTWVAAWAVMFSYARFYIPILPLIVPLAVAVVIAAARAKTWLAQGMFMSFLSGQALSMPVQFWVIPERIPHRNALGIESDEDFLTRVHRGIPAARYLNRHAAPGETAVGLGFERVRHYLDIPFHSWRDMPEVQTISHIAEPARLAEALDRHGYDWLIIDELEPDNGEKYLAQPFLECFAELRFRDRQHAVYRLRELGDSCQ